MYTSERFMSEQESLHRFRHFLFMFRLSGLPLLYKEVPKFYNLYSIIILISFILTTVAVIMDAFVQIEDLERSMESIRLVVPYTMIVWMYCFFRVRIKAIGRLLSLSEPFVWEDLPTRDPETGSLSMAGWIPRIGSFTRGLSITLISYHYIDTTYRILTMDTHPLPLNTWYPFDISVSPVYELIIVSQVLASWVNTFFLFGFNGLYATLVSIACSQLDKLRNDLLKVGETSITTKRLIVVNDDYSEETEPLASDVTYQQATRQLNDCIRRHQYILSYLNAMEDAFNPVMVGIFLFQLVSMCLSSFSIVTSWGNYGQVVQATLVYGVLLILQANYCWFGSQLSFQAEKIREAAYGCNWVGAPIPFQRNVVMIITRANVEFTFTAGKFVAVNIKTLMNMVNQSVSYFMFLLEVTKRIESDEEIKND